VTAVREPEQLAIPVAGGDLSVLHWPAARPDAPLVVLVHGITANAMAWERVASGLGDDFDVVAADLRGRAGSARLPGPYGMARHAEDVTALLHRRGVHERRDRGGAVLVGHSMGGFVATHAAAGPARHLVHGLVLVDGGLELAQPPGADIDAMLAAILGPSLDRLGRTFPDLTAVRAFWAEHPAVGPWVDVPSVAAYLARDLLGSQPPHLHSACVPEAIRIDGADTLDNELIGEAASALPVPATLLWASRGLLDQSPGLYDNERLAHIGVQELGIAAREVPDTNHYSIVWARHGVDAVTSAIRDASATRPAV
jgi:pimeloyl-ACP methyl ester carboxylesterase